MWKFERRRSNGLGATDDTIKQTNNKTHKHKKPHSKN